MLRITQQIPPEGRPLLLLEGRLVGPWVAELRGAAAAGGGAALVDLDLAGVTFADDHGVAALRDLRGAGARLVRASAFLAALIGTEHGPDRRVD
jgi:hypothetical protein